MGKTTGISYVEATWNPWYGCHPVSLGCQNCYAKRYWKCLGLKPGEVRRATDTTFYAPFKWKEPKRIMVCSLSDFFHEVADEWRQVAIWIMESESRHTYIIPTKRPERMIKCLYNKESRLPLNKGDWLSNVWFLASVENQEMADRRIPELLKLKEYGKWNLGLSVEPMLGEIHIEDHVFPENKNGIDWVICGGESGSNARPCHPDWMLSLRDQCVEAGVIFFFKQWGEWAPALELYGEFKPIKTYNRIKIWEDKEISFKVGKKAAGCMLDGREWKDYPK